MFTHNVPEVIMEVGMLSTGMKIQGMKYPPFPRTRGYKCKYLKCTNNSENKCGNYCSSRKK